MTSGHVRDGDPTTDGRSEAHHSTAVGLRSEPIQARSAARLSGLLDSAAAIIDEFGYERLTTAMVAERAEASIGTIYRYFPDRIALLRALAHRNLDRILDETAAAINDPASSDPVDALMSAIEVIVGAFRTEPGYRALRVGDVIDVRPAPEPRNTAVAAHLLRTLDERFGIGGGEQAQRHFEVMVEVVDALASRAFARDASGDETFLIALREFAERSARELLVAR